MPELSVVMIVKDEAACLGRCLASVRDIADEIVAGDTGSTDATPAIAAGFGARVIRVPWRDDFAWAVMAVRIQREVGGNLAEILEVIAHTIAALLGAGAFDAWATPIVMKKGRPAHTVHALCDAATASAIGEVLLRETGSLGLRGTTLMRCQ